MASAVPPTKGVAFSCETALVSQADTDIFKAGPTLAAGDVKVVKDGVYDDNIDALPTAVTSCTNMITVALSATEMNADRVAVILHDAAGDEWQDQTITIFTGGQSLDSLWTKIQKWLRLALRKDAAAAADQAAELAEINANGGSGAGAYASTTDSQEAIKDALPAAAPAMITSQEVRDAMKLAPTTGAPATGSVDKHLDDATAAGDPWAAAERTLTQPAASVLAAVTGSGLNVVKGRTYDATLTGVTIQATWTGIKFTAKANAREADTLSLLQVVVSNPAAATDGTVYIAGAAATEAQRAQASLTVDQIAGSVALHLQDDLTALLALVDGGGYDITQYYTDGSETKSTQLTRGAWTTSPTETGALS